LTDAETRYAVIEKEALAITWACERLRQYLVGKKFKILTDHRPLVSLLQKKRLDELPVRIQRFRLRMLLFAYDIEYIPGKEQVIADALSRAPLPEVSNADFQLSQVVLDYSRGVLRALPASDSCLERIRQAQDKDEVFRNIKQFCCDGWPIKVPLAFRMFHSVRHELSVVDGLLVKGTRLVIPRGIRSELLGKIHAGHQGETKCQQRARMSVWWPGISVEIKNLVARCAVCCRERINNAEPMVATELPARPWQRVGTDLFMLSGKIFVLVVDYFSRFVEAVQVASSSVAQVVPVLKSIFSRFGVPEVVVSDGGPPYNSNEFAKFAELYGFEHALSSPRYPQGNAEAERAVRTVKGLLRKSVASGEDFLLALLSYRTSPLNCGNSPGQLLMGRQLRSPLPLLPSCLEPKWPDLQDVKRSDASYKSKMKKNYDRRHKSHTLPRLSPGDEVFVKDLNDRCEVISEGDVPRSYRLNHNGREIRRNRRHMVFIPPVKNQDSTPTIVKEVTPGTVIPEPETGQPLRRSQRSTKGVPPVRYGQ